jgi:uncharacterized protein (DUF58 family)
MRPTLRTVLLFLAGGPLALLVTLIDPALWTMWISSVSGSVVLVGFDFLVGLPRRRVRVVAEVPETLYIADRDPLRLRITARGWQRATRLNVIVDLDSNLQSQPEIATSVVPGGERQIEVALVPKRRGMVKVERVVLQWRGPLGLTRRQRTVDVNQSVAVVPNVRAVRSVALNFTTRDALV